MAQNMTHTVIGLFDGKTQAQAAMAELVKGGFIKENIDLSNRRAGTSPAHTSADTADESVGESIGNFFSSMFGTDSPEARSYSDVASDTEAILTVQTDSAERSNEAAAILDRNGAVDVDERAGRNRQKFAQQGRTTEGDQKISVMEENLQLGKREVEGGGVRVRSRIIEKPVEETIRLREEHVTVNRQPVDRAVTEGEFANFKEGDIDISERSEQAVVSKDARVTEEISIGKNVEERDETVSDTVRSTEVDVEQINDAKSRKANN